MARSVVEQGQAKGERVLPGFVRQLIDEGLVEEGVMRMADRAPVADRHAASRGNTGDALVGDAIGLVEQTFAGRLVGRVERTGERRQVALHPARRHGIAGAGHAQRGGPAIGAETGAQHGDTGGAIEVVAEVFLARPDELNRPAAALDGDAHRLADRIDFQAPAEAAAEIGDVHGDILDTDTGDLGGDGAGQSRHLCWRPDFDLATGHLRGAVDRLHRRMREIRGAVGPLDVRGGLRFGGADIAARVKGKAAAAASRVDRGALEAGDDGRALEPADRPLLPVDDERSRPLSRVPPGAADDGQGLGRAGVRAETDDAFDAGHLHGRRDIDGARAAADHRAMPDRGVEKSLRPHVDAEDGRAVGLRHDVDARRRRADQLPLCPALQADGAARRGSGDPGKLAIVRRYTRGVADDAVLDRQLARRLLPCERGRTEQLGPGRGCGQTQHLPGIGNARRAARHVDAELARHLGDGPLHGPGRRRFAARLGVARMEPRHACDEDGHVAVQALVRRGEETHAGQRHVELLGDQHGQRGVRALAHLAAVHGQQDAAVGSDLDPAVEVDLAFLQRQAVDAAEPAARRQDAPTDDQRTRGSEPAEQQRAAFHRRGLMSRRRRAAARPRRYGSRHGCGGRCRSGRCW